jgi:hypothetical protein
LLARLRRRAGSAVRLVFVAATVRAHLAPPTSTYWRDRRRSPAPSRGPLGYEQLVVSGALTARAPSTASRCTSRVMAFELRLDAGQRSNTRLSRPAPLQASDEQAGVRS